MQKIFKLNPKISKIKSRILVLYPKRIYEKDSKFKTTKEKWEMKIKGKIH